MPELPEVETIRRYLADTIVNSVITKVTIRNPNLRWPVPSNLSELLRQQMVRKIRRRAKYLLFDCSSGTLLLHLGMSGRLLLCDASIPPTKHDHIDFFLDNSQLVRFNDPRRFGAIVWTTDEPHDHPLLANLGPEPFDAAFSANYLYRLSRNRRVSIKGFIMDSRVVAGIGNIYANEALFEAGIRPSRPVGRISRIRYQRLVEAIRRTLDRALAQGGTTLRNYQNASGAPGYFQLTLKVYGSNGKLCPTCGNPIAITRIAQRTTFFCPRCQR